MQPRAVTRRSNPVFTAALHRSSDTAFGISSYYHLPMLSSTPISELKAELFKALAHPARVRVLVA